MARIMVIGRAEASPGGGYVLRVKKLVRPDYGFGTAKWATTDIAIRIGYGARAPREGTDVLVEGDLLLDNVGAFYIMADRIEEER